MDANATRFHMLLGRADWGHCLVGGRPLETVWATEEAVNLDWDVPSRQLILRPRPNRFITGRGDRIPRPDDRRGAAADRYGNWYWIDADRQRLRVGSAGGGVSDFWPLAAHPAGRHGDFREVRAALPQAEEFSGLVVTSEAYLLVGTVRPAGFLVFDLLGGGAPMTLGWPGDDEFAVFDMAARPGGGAVVLDRWQRRVWVLDRNLSLASLHREEGGALTSGGFRPLQGTAGEECSVPRGRPRAIELDADFPPGTLDPVAIECLPDDSVLILDGGAADRPARVVRYLGRELREMSSLAVLKGLLEAEDAQDLVLQAHDFAFVPAAGREVARLLIASREGNQAFAFALELTDGVLHLQPLAEYLPMRRFGGKGLVYGRGFVHYDFAERWLPLVAERRPRYAESAGFLTPAFDGDEPDCVWHRLMLDACIPSDCSVHIRSRSAEALELLESAPWQDEPPLYRRGDGSELPWLPVSGESSDSAEGTFELLLQNARSRYLQLEVVLRGNLRSTPRLSALRVWFPRFSYLAQYLPTVYREEDREARFLERFLANFEGLFTAIEDRIAAAQVLFDVRTAPQDTLDWLAAWLGIVLDPSWDEARRRRFIRHAMLLFRFRGTVHGIRLALQLATAECVEAADLMPATPERERAFGIRIVERYRARRLPGVLLGEPLAASGPRAGSLQARWTPAEGRARLAQRYQDYLQARGIAAAGLDFPLSPPDEDGLRGAWESFAREQLGFVPAGSEGERLQWQRFLSLRYPDVSRLKARYEWSDFAAVRLPRDWPEIADQRQDWRDFIAETSSATSERGRWQAFLARRYRALRELNAAYRTRWPGFELLALPEGLPPDGAALADWHAYEATVRPMRQAAHRFVVYLPTRDLGSDPVRVADRLSLAHRIIELEKPAHTVFDVRQYLALFRIGEARLGHDTLLGSGSRAPELMPAFVLGRNHLGIGHLAPRDPLPGDRRELAC